MKIKISYANIGIKITGKCDFKCRHCMYSSDSNGEHMSDETIEIISNLLKDSKRYTISFYGGEPFLDIEHFDKCWRAFYDKKESYFISSNGSFVLDPERFRYVRDLINQFGKTTFSEQFTIRISNTIYHQENWDPKYKYRILYSVVRDSYSYYDYYKELNGEYDEPYHSNPFLGDKSDTYIYFDSPIDKPLGEVCVNPSGRALEFGIYNPDRMCNCVLSSDDFNLEEGICFNFDEFGNIELCGCCQSGTIGNVRKYPSLKAIAIGIKKFRDKFRSKYPEVNNQSKMIDVCQKCRDFSYK